MHIPFTLIKHENHAKMKDQLMEIINTAEGGELRNNWNWVTHTDWNVRKEAKREYWDLFWNDVKDQFDELLRLKFRHIDWELDNYWFQQYQNGDWHHWHRHPQTAWNCVYYLEKPTDSPDTVFWDAEAQDVVSGPVEEGDILMFPSQVVHCVPEITGGQRTVIVWNIK